MDAYDGLQPRRLPAGAGMIRFLRLITARESLRAHTALGCDTDANASGCTKLRCEAIRVLEPFLTADARGTLYRRREPVREWHGSECRRDRKQGPENRGESGSCGQFVRPGSARRHAATAAGARTTWWVEYNPHYGGIWVVRASCPFRTGGTSVPHGGLSTTWWVEYNPPYGGIWVVRASCPFRTGGTSVPHGGLSTTHPTAASCPFRTGGPPVNQPRSALRRVRESRDRTGIVPSASSSRSACRPARHQRSRCRPGSASLSPCCRKLPSIRPPDRWPEEGSFTARSM